MKSYLKLTALKLTAESPNSVVKNNSGWEGLLSILPASENRLMMCIQDTRLKCSFQRLTPPSVRCISKLPMQEGNVATVENESGISGHWCDFFIVDFLLPLCSYV